MADKPKRSKKRDEQSGSSWWDGCFYVSFDGCVDFGGGDGCIDLPGDGCLSGIGDGCLEGVGGGCFDGFGDGCSGLDGCSLGCLVLPLRIIVILGLRVYGDWPVPPPNHD
jgi:hypothetical protein